MPVSRFYTENALGPKRRFTPEGFLVCSEVPIARTGTLLYAAGEVPIDAGRDGIVGIMRDADDVFSPDAIASFEGMPVTNDHPPLGIKVDPTNWRQLAIGDVHNVRRGDGALLDDQYLYADLIIKDAKAIQDVLDGKREVSAGYDAEYEQLEPGRGRQHDIIGNHVALVDKGRCGPHCSIGDSDTMATKRVSYRDRILNAFKTRDADALVQELDKVGDMLGEVVSDDMPAGMDLGGGHAINLHFNGMGAPGAPKTKMPASDEGEEMPAAGGAQAAPGMQPGGQQPAAGGDMPPWAQAMMQRMETIEQAVMLLAQDEGDGDDDSGEEPADAGGDAPGKVGDDAAEIEGEQKQWPHGDPGKVQTGDRRATVGDSTSLAPDFQDMLARAAVLVPGIRLPTLDTAKGAKTTLDGMCTFRRSTLAKAWGTTDGRDAIGTLYTARRPDFSRDAMTCDAVTAIYNGAAEILKGSNTRDSARGLAAVMDHGREVQSAASRPLTPAEINAKARARYGITA